MDLYVQLGRYGDVLGILPVLYHQFIQTGRRQHLVISHEFVDLLDGVSYVEPLVFDGHRDELAVGLAFARKHALRKGMTVRRLQVNGHGVQTTKRTECFMRDAWFNTGADRRWDKLSLVLDRRSSSREEALTANWFYGEDKPRILLATTSYSSPFERTTLDAAVRQLEDDFEIIDMSKVHAERLYDLLGMFDRAHALITVDTSLLHLAAASNIPVCALVNPKPWYGSLPRANHVYHAPYDAIDADVLVQQVRGMTPGDRQFVHVFPEWSGKDDATAARQAIAEQSWKLLGAKWRHLGVTPERTSRSIGDHRSLPFVRDLIERGMKDCKGPHDVVVITNSDVGMVPETHHYLRSLSNRGAVFAYRFNHDLITGPMTRFENLHGKWDGGLDLFAFTRWWWEKHQQHFPDMIMGAPRWDLVYRDTIKRLGGCELHGCVWHQTHRSVWKEDRNPVSNNFNEAIWRKHRAKYDPTRCYAGLWNIATT